MWYPQAAGETGASLCQAQHLTPVFKKAGGKHSRGSGCSSSSSFCRRVPPAGGKIRPFLAQSSFLETEASLAKQDAEKPAHLLPRHNRARDAKAFPSVATLKEILLYVQDPKTTRTKELMDPRAGGQATR